jgi:methylated-DNA-protein-cysteine methyltransferase-like protein
MSAVAVARVLDIVRSLREGEVVSYGDVADDAGRPGRSRLVGNVLAGNDDPELPWLRVVNSVGRLVPGNELEQAARLRAEGVSVSDGRVRRARYGRFSSGPISSGRSRL